MDEAFIIWLTGMEVKLTFVFSVCECDVYVVVCGWTLIKRCSLLPKEHFEYGCQKNLNRCIFSYDWKW